MVVIPIWKPNKDWENRGAYHKSSLSWLAHHLPVCGQVYVRQHSVGRSWAWSIQMVLGLSIRRFPSIFYVTNKKQGKAKSQDAWQEDDLCTTKK